MFGLETLDGPTRAVAQVGIVLAEAIILYVVYGGLSALLSERVLDAVEGGD